jgi:hypothetical protein
MARRAPRGAKTYALHACHATRAPVCTLPQGLTFPLLENANE